MWFNGAVDVGVHDSGQECRGLRTSDHIHVIPVSWLANAQAPDSQLRSPDRYLTTVAVAHCPSKLQGRHLAA